MAVVPELVHQRYLDRVTELYRPSELVYLSNRFDSWADRIGRQDIKERLTPERPMVYFSAEYGLPGNGANGGLGMLSRDHFLEAYDLGIPGIFLGLRYQIRKRQRIETNGKAYWQVDVEETLPTPEELGMEQVPVDVVLNGRLGRDNHIPVYRYPVGNARTELFLLQVPGEVYPESPGSNIRLWHEVVLGFGGYQVVKQLIEQHKIIEPAFYHLNESATVLGALAALDDMTMRYGDNQEAYDRALQELRAKTILTNHTLVPAAEASYGWKQCEEVIFSNLHSTQVLSELKAFISRYGGSNLTLLDLAFHLAGKYNAVSEIHAREAAKNFRQRYNVDFRAVTNGIYGRGWNPVMENFLEGAGVVDEFGMPSDDMERRIDQIPTSVLWGLKKDAVEVFRKHLLNGEQRDQFGRIIELRRDAVIVGDARRVADYKRRNMMFHDIDRLKRILIKHPRAHIFMAGKAHPDDTFAKGILEHDILDVIANDRFLRQRIHFLPDWNPEVMKVLGPACHVWLNNPRVLREACGTSGEKTGRGGALQVSTVDGFYGELREGSYYAITGDTDSEAEFDSYYRNLERAIRHAETPKLWAQGVRRLWKGGLLELSSGGRMLAQYVNFALPEEEEQAA